MTETELLFTELLNCTRTDLYLNKQRNIDKEKLSFISSVLKRRINAEPLQYILGKTEFMGFEFKVTPDVLIPRQETEILVETALKKAGTNAALRILDIGTGSGCIAVSLARMLQNARITATDISVQALEIARHNAALHSVSGIINFINTDLFPPVNGPEDPELEPPPLYDIIVSNPPYIPCNQIDNLQPEIKYEPGIALDGGNDGLAFYRKIIPLATQFLRKDGFLILETGFNQRESIENIFRSSAGFEIIEVVKDYNNIERVIIAQLSAVSRQFSA